MYFGHCTVSSARVFARLPDHLCKVGQQSNRTAGMRGAAASPHSFFEGPAFNPAGVLHVTDVPFGRIFRIDADGQFTLAMEYDGHPCGMKFRPDGSAVICDKKLGLMRWDPVSGTVTALLVDRHGENFRGVNDLVFADNGDLYFTDQGLSDLRDATGRVFCLQANGTLRLLLENGPSPNGIALSADGNTLFIAMTRANAIWKAALMTDGSLGRVSAWATFSGGGGPDGIAATEDGGLVVVHAGLGVVWVLDRWGEPVARIESPTDRGTTNLAMSPSDRRTAFITESHSGVVLRATLPTQGVQLH